MIIKQDHHLHHLPTLHPQPFVFGAHHPTPSSLTHNDTPSVSSSAASTTSNPSSTPTSSSRPSPPSPPPPPPPPAPQPINIPPPNSTHQNLLNRTGSSSHTGRHRRKSSVSISPPFSRTPSPIDPSLIINLSSSINHHQPNPNSHPNQPHPHHRHHRTPPQSIIPTPSSSSPLPPSHPHPNPVSLQTTQLENDILSRPRSIPSSSLYSNIRLQPSSSSQ